MNQARSASPELHEVEGEILVLLPRLLKDDYNVFVQEGAVRTDHLADAFLEGMEKLRAVGGLAVVAGHTQIMGTNRRLNVLRSVADRAAEDGDWWIARAEGVADWWKARAGVRLTFVGPEGAGAAALSVQGAPDPGGSADRPEGYRSEVVYEVLVEGPSESDVQGLWVDILLPERAEELVPLLDGVPLPFTTTEWGMRVPVVELPAGESRRITLQTMPPEDPEGGR